MKKKLIYIIGSLNVGGAERHITTILPLLAARGWLVQVITLNSKGILAGQLESKDIPVISMLEESFSGKIKSLPKWIARLVCLMFIVCRLTDRLKKEKKDTVLNFFLPEAYIIGMLSATLARFRGDKIMSRRSLNFHQVRRPIVGRLERRIHSKVNAITGNSQAIVSQLEKEEKVDKNKLHLIYNGVDVVPFLSVQPKDELKAKLKIEKDAFIIIHVANLIPYKGHADLLDALNKVKENMPAAWYLISVGRDEGIREALIKQTKKLNLQDRVLWLGLRNDIPDLLSIANMAVLCSHEEGFSNAILEGMAAGLPMVVTDVGGNKEAVLHNQTGYVVPAKDIEALGNAILRLAWDPEKRLTFGVAGRKRVETYFSLDACVQAYEKLYQSLSK